MRKTKTVVQRSTHFEQIPVEVVEKLATPPKTVVTPTVKPAKPAKE